MSLRVFRENPGIQKYPKNEAEWKHFINEVAKWISDNAQITSDISTLQTDVVSAARSGAYATSIPSGYVWRSDPSGTYPASDPTFDIATTFYDETGTQVAARTLRGSLTSSNGNIAVTAVSNSQSTGYSTSYALTNDGTDSVLATMTLTLPDSSEMEHSVSWNSMDISAAGGTPATGGGK